MSVAPDKPSVTPSVSDERVTFIQHRLPGLDDGSYELDISQHVDDAQGDPISGETLSRTYRFAVTGDRFRLSDPAATVASTFPASDGTGEYTTVLANVVFSSATFPWARYPTNSPPALPPPGTDTDADVPTWLALLVLDADDVAGYPGLALDPVTGVLGDLFPAAAYPQTTLGDNYSYFEGATDTSALEVDETVADPVQTIDLPLALFADIAPTLGDLELSAHVRQLSVQNKPVALGAQPQVDPLGTFAIVVGTRLPQSDTKSYAYLVSLEAMEDYLPATSAGGTLNDPSLDPSRSLRLAVLTYWTFNTKGETAAFVDRLELLNDRTIGGPDAPNTNLRVSVAAATPPISTALEAGYVPLDHDLRSAETTVSWYRGPLSPVDGEPPPIDLPITSPDQALVFDPTTGMLDASLAAAWTIGRLVALQDSSFASSLYAWKQGLAQSVVDAAERQIIDDVLGALFASAGDLAGDPRPDTKALLHNTMRLIRSQGSS
jgi:hypothetical protein